MADDEDFDELDDELDDGPDGDFDLSGVAPAGAFYEAPEGYRIFKEKEDNCVRAVFLPN